MLRAPRASRCSGARSEVGGQRSEVGGRKTRPFDIRRWTLGVRRFPHLFPQPPRSQTPLARRSLGVGGWLGPPLSRKLRFLRAPASQISHLTSRISHPATRISDCL